MSRTPPTTRRPGWAFRLAAALVIAFVRLMRWQIRVHGLDNVPEQGGALVTFNHHSYSDFFVCAWAIYRDEGRAVRFLAKQELFDMPVVGWLLRQAKQVPVARGSRTGRKEAFAAAVDALRSGELIAIAPEQTISRSFELLPLSSGAVRMAQQAQVPIIPSVSWGTQRFATKGRPIDWGARRIPVLVRYGSPIHVTADGSLEDANDRLRAAMEEMLEDLQRRYPDQPRSDEDAWWQPRRLGGAAPPHDEVLREHAERERVWRQGRADDDPPPETS